ncbi:hypothetical protein ACLMJK_002118 [Lecanora helva]
MCDCNRKAVSKGSQGYLSSTSNKHRAGSPLAPTAKRPKHSTIAPQSIEIGSQFAGPDTDWPQISSSMSMESLTGQASMEECTWDSNIGLYQLNDMTGVPWRDTFFPFDVTEMSGAWIGGDFSSCPETAYPNQGLGCPHSMPNLTPTPPPTQSPTHEMILTDSRPADFLAVQETQDFRDIVVNLQTIDTTSPFPSTTLVTYNAVKETITLVGFSQPKLEKAMTNLRRLFNDFSLQWGGKYLMSSPTSVESESCKSRICWLDAPNAQSHSAEEQAKIFPIKPKDDRLLVRLWIGYIVPALPKILKPILGMNYAASLVRRGQIGIRAKPCILIESPHVPGLEAQQIIRSSIDGVFESQNHRRVAIRFSQGSVRKLNGEAEEDNDLAGETAESQRFRFNLVRPFSKPRMGASLGLKCSKKLVATLGGYVLIDGEKYMLTSEHFVAQSQEPTNIDENDSDLETLTSPSRFDLIWMENDLKQTKRDLDYQIDLRARQIYGDQDILVNEGSDPSILTPEMREKVDNVACLIRQVKKPYDAYAVGTVLKRSAEPKVAAIAKSIADVARLEDEQVEALYHMDWALCQLNGRIAQIGENRHKYRSHEDAMADDYIEEIDHANQPGEACNETCEVSAGVSVYYVGQGSKHRSGSVNIPTLVSRDGSATLDWTIVSTDGYEIPYSHVAGDSGAWVIQKSGNKLMGQVHSYSCGQVLFTPISVIFADIGKECGVEVSLPPSPPTSGQLGTTTSAAPLCSRPPTPPVRSLKFLKPSIAIPPVLQDAALARPANSRIRSLDPEKQTQRNGQSSSTSSDQSPSFLPSLTNSPQSSAASPDCPHSPSLLDLSELCDTRAEDSQALPESSPIIQGQATDFGLSSTISDEEVEIETAKSAPSISQWRSDSLFRLISNPRMHTWPLLLKRSFKEIQYRHWALPSQALQKQESSILSTKKTAEIFAALVGKIPVVFEFS